MAKIRALSNYNANITADGTDSGEMIGSLSASLNADSLGFAISATLNSKSVAPAVVQKQLTEFIDSIREEAFRLGLDGFGANPAKKGG